MTLIFIKLRIVVICKAANHNKPLSNSWFMNENFFFLLEREIFCNKPKSWFKTHNKQIRQMMIPLTSIVAVTSLLFSFSHSHFFLLHVVAQRASEKFHTGKMYLILLLFFCVWEKYQQQFVVILGEWEKRVVIYL